MEIPHRIVAIAENQEIRRQIQACFDGAGMRVEFVSRAVPEVKAALGPRPSLLVLDYSGLEEESVELVREVRGEPTLSETPILLLADCQQERIVDALEAGAAGFICKPLRSNELLMRTRLLLDMRALARASAARRELSPQRYAEVFASSAYAIAVFDAECKVLLANPGFYQLLGYQEKELEGRPFWDLVSENEQAVIRSALRRLQQGWPSESHDLPICRKGGEVRIIECSFSSLVGIPEEILVLFRDVTEASGRREELVKSKTFLESLIGASVDAIVACDMKGTIILFNRAAERIYIRRAEDVLNKLFVGELYVGDGARAVGRMLRSEKFGGRIGPIRVEGKDSKGNTFPVSLTAAIIYDEHNNPIATCGIFTDLRERLRVEQELARVQEKLAVSEKQALIAEVAGTTAHELNQPLTGVMGYSEILLRKLDPASEAAHAANAIHREAERMAEIVRKIGKLTKYETRTYVGEQKILDLDRSSGDD